MRIVLEVDAPAGHAIGVKEALAMDVEKYGDVRVVSVEVREPEQMRIGGADTNCFTQKAARRVVATPDGPRGKNNSIHLQYSRSERKMQS